MQDLTKAAIAALLTGEEGEPKVTIYAPMHTTATPPHMTENQIRLKNLIHKAAEELRTNYGHDGKKMADMLGAELEKYLNNPLFWESQTEGLLLCAQPNAVQVFHLPIDTEEYVAVDNCYHVAPVLALLNDEQSFYVLAVSQHSPKLFAGSMYGLCDMETDMPSSLEASLGIDERNQKSDHSQALGDDVSFNGRGGVRDPRQDERLRFFRIIDSIACANTERGLPLILAGTDSEIAEYRHISKHHNILPQTVGGSFGGAKAHDLFEPAYTIIHDQLIAGRRRRAVAEYDRLKGTRKERIAEDPLAIAEAAKQGRIDTLLITLRRSTTDTVRDTAKAVERLTFPRAELSALINKTANAVAGASGKIVNLEVGALAGNGSIRAVLRY
jgi:hypothetical protein